MPIRSLPGDQPVPEDVERMNQIEREIAKAIARDYQENTEVALIAGALLRIVRKLYDKYPEGVRAELLEGAVAYLIQKGPREASTIERAERLGLNLAGLARMGKKARRPH